MQQKFYQFLREERDRGKTIFMSSHILAEVEEVCDRVAIIRDARLQVVERIDSLKEKMGKTLEIELDQDINPDLFDIPGVDGLEVEGRRAKMIVTCDLDQVIKRVSEHNIVNMSLETFNLDQFFMTYYSQSGGE